MQIIDLTDDHHPLFALCLEDWSDDAREAGPTRGCWVDRFRRRGLRGKLALDDDGTVGGMIQYLPIEHSFVDGEGLYMIHCIHVHGYDQGRGNFQKRGMGTALLAAAEDDARALGAKGMAAWGMWLPLWMKASWFRKHGYRKAHRQGISMLVYKPFEDDARPPRWFPADQRKPELVPGKVTVTALVNGWCLAMNLTYERAKRASADLAARGLPVVFQQIDTSERDTVREWGISDAIYVDHKKIGGGPPPTYAKIHATITRRLRRLSRQLPNP